MRRWVTLLSAAFLGVAALVAVLHGSHHCLSLAYPPRSDQETYLQEGKAAAAGTLAERSPLYSLWMAGFFDLAGGDLRRTCALEKLGGTLLLAVATALLGGRLFGAATATLLGAWVMNCKYLLEETNGSHALAGALWASGAFVLASSLHRRRELGLTLLFLTTQVRYDMRAPFALVVLFLAAQDSRDAARGPKDERRRLVASWSSLVLICACLFAGLHAHTDRDMPNRLSVAFRQSFAVTYAERHELLARFPDAWNTWPAIWDEALPGAPDVPSALRKYPGALLGHVLYQAGLSLRAVPAMVFAFDVPWIMWLLVPSYLGVSAWQRLGPRMPRGSARLRDAATAGLALLVLVPVSCLIRVAARNYVQLIPLELVAAVVVLHAGLSAVRRHGRGARA
jgi:hypothetical protein